MISRDVAERYALSVLTWLVGQEDLIGLFMGASGASVEDLKQGAGSPEFLGAVLDFVLMDDQWVIRFAQENNEKPDLMMQARAVLPGGEAVHWT
jgi:hypothetical protein